MNTTGEDLGYKPDLVQKAKFEYSPLGQVFNKGLDTSEKQVGLLKRLKNIEDKTDRELEENKDNQLGIKSIGYAVRQESSQEAKNMFKKLNSQEKLINYQKIGFTGDNKRDCDFTNSSSSLREIFRAIYYGQILILAVEREQDNFDDMIKMLKDYKPINSDNKEKEKLLINAQSFYDGREMIIEDYKNDYKNKTFRFYSGNYYHDLAEKTSEIDDGESEKDKA